MARYIDATALLNKVERYFAGLPIRVHHDMVEYIMKAPSANVEEVVHCEDCKYYDEYEMQCYDTRGFDRWWKPLDFCSYGERREQ